jgi:hypothetical protein
VATLRVQVRVVAPSNVRNSPRSSFEMTRARQELTSANVAMTVEVSLELAIIHTSCDRKHEDALTLTNYTNDRI